MTVMCSIVACSKGFYSSLRAPIFMAVLAVSALSFLGASTALAQSSQNDANTRLNRIENEIQTLSRAVFRGEAPPAGFQSGAPDTSQAAIANMEVRLAQMETQIRQLTGQLEQQTFQIRQLETQIQAQTQTIQSMQSMQSGAAAQNYGQGAQNYGGFTQNPAQASPQAMGQQAQQGVYASPIPDPATAPMPNGVNGASGTLPVTGGVQVPANTSTNMAANTLGAINPNGANPQNPTYMYDSAFSMLQQGDYETAQNALQNFITTYPEHPLVSNAQYWLGETFYIRNNFAEAAKVFAIGYQKYPQSPKAPDNLLKLALSLSNLGQNDEACVTLVQLKTQYPAAVPAIIRKADDESKRLSCPAAE